MAFKLVLSSADLSIFVACVVAALGLLVLRRALRGRARSVDSEKSSPAVKERVPGEWTPVPFDYPRFTPSTEELGTIKPIAYRPFKWGDYYVTMAVRTMPWDQWVELDQQFPEVHALCEQRIRARGERVVRINAEQPGVVQSGRAAAEEFVHELAEYLSRRHPKVYAVVRSEKEFDGWYGEGRIKDITIVPLQKTYKLDEEDPMKVAALLVQEDFVLMVEGTDGRYYLQAAALCIAGSWRLEDKIGLALDEVHISGHVPQYQSKLHLSMSRFFRRMPLDKPVVRNNYAFQVVKEGAETADPNELSWAETMNGSEDMPEFQRAARIRDAPTQGPSAAASTPATPSTLYLRSERQTLRRLPRTGAIAFGIHVYQTPVSELTKEPGVPGRMASALRSWPEDVARYKAKKAFDDILPYLDACHAEQIAKGMISSEERESNYPF
ncbi:hypothetical protein A0H81_08181 [Grifola frondosa]|uniref:Uncharacterized protein n=1 Tax=Grifola frondosa TaxID=5627 RepID=A0A1C7M676_GRIFR|nr:hypothetical protein A0H81_08181 [Grifola frondosa]